MREKFHIKFFTWREEDREKVVLGPGTRINPATNRAQLGTYSEASYPTTDDLYVKSRVTTPLRLRQWVGFEATVYHKTVDDIVVTSAGFRLSYGGASQYWWDGAAWVVSATEWSSETDVALHIDEFPIGNKNLLVFLNLATSDSSETPELEEIKILYSTDSGSELDDLVERSFVPFLRSQLKPITRVVVVKDSSDALDEIDLSKYKVDTDYRFIDVDSVYCHTDDASHAVDLYNSHTIRSVPDDPWHNGTVGVITLTQDVAAGKTIWLCLVYEPVVTLNTNPDYYELAHVPAVVIERLVYSGREMRGPNYVANKANGTAKVLPMMLQGRLELGLAVTIDKVYDAFEMISEIEQLLGDSQMLRSVGLDENYRMRQLSAFDMSTAVVDNDLRTFRTTLCLEDVVVCRRGGTEEYLVDRFLVTGVISVEITNDPPT